MNRRKVTLWTVVILIILADGFSFAEGRDGGLSSETNPSAEAAALPSGEYDVTAEPVGTESLDDWLEYAERNNPDIAAAYHRWLASLENVSRARTLPDPKLSYTYYARRIETRLGPQRHAFNVSQTFPWFGTRDLRKEVAEGGANALAMQYDALRRKIRYRVSKPWYEYYYAAHALEAARGNLALLVRVESVVRARYTAGKASYADLLRIQVEAGKLEERVLDLEGLAKPLAAQFNAAVNRPVDAPIAAPSALPVPSPLPPDDILRKRMAETNPDIGELQALIVRESKAAELAGKSFFPDITLGVNYIETGQSPMPGVDGSGRDALLGMVSISIPLWRDSYRSTVREAELRRRALERTREARTNDLGASLSRTVYDIGEANRRIELYSGVLIPKIRETLDISISRYEAGEGTFTEILDTLRTMLEFETAIIRAEADRSIYYAEIELLTGVNGRDTGVEDTRRITP